MFLPPNIRAYIEPELSDLGNRILAQDIFDAITDSERNLPYLRGSGRDAFGQPRADALVVTEGWTKIQNFGIENGYGPLRIASSYSFCDSCAESDVDTASLRTIMTRAMLSTTGSFKCSGERALVFLCS